MARIVLLRFRQNDAAEDFVRAMATGTEEEPILFLRGSASVEAVVAQPTVWCVCPAVPWNQPEQTRAQARRRKSRSKRELSYSRGKHFGWWCCVHCRKPSKAAVEHWVTSMLVGANDLLPEILGTGPPVDADQRWRSEPVPNGPWDARFITVTNDPARRSPPKPRRKDLHPRSAP